MLFCSLFSLMPHLLSGIVFYTIFVFFCLNIYKSLLSGFYHKINLFVFIIISVILGWVCLYNLFIPEGGKTWLNLCGKLEKKLSSYFPIFKLVLYFNFTLMTSKWFICKKNVINFISKNSLRAKKKRKLSKTKKKFLKFSYFYFDWKSNEIINLKLNFIV